MKKNFLANSTSAVIHAFKISLMLSDIVLCCYLRAVMITSNQSVIFSNDKPIYCPLVRKLSSICIVLNIDLVHFFDNDDVYYSRVEFEYKDIDDEIEILSRYK